MKRDKIQEETLAKIRRMVEEGATYETVSFEFSVSKTSVCRAMNRIYTSGRKNHIQYPEHLKTYAENISYNGDDYSEQAYTRLLYLHIKNPSFRRHQWTENYRSDILIV